MAYEKQTWISYDDNKTEEQNIKDGAVVTAERMNHLETGLDEHDKNTTNPHKVTKAQVGLSNVTNVEQASKTEFNSHLSSKTNPHGVTKTQVGLGNVTNVEQAGKTEFDSHVADKKNPHSVTKAQVNLGNVDNYATANQTDAEQGLAGNKFITPMGVKQHVDNRMATQAEVNEGEATDKLVSPKTLADLLSKKMPLKMYWGPGSTLNDSNLNDRLTFGDLIGIDPFHKSSDIPFTINSGKYEATMTRDADLFFDINLRLQGGGASTVYSDYYYIQLEYGSQTGGSGESKKDFAMIGANNGQRLNLSNTLTGKAIVSLKKGQKFAITATGLRSGQKIFFWQFLSGTIEEYILT